MSIASALVAAQGRVADAYTAISNKGGTLPATQNLTNMPTAINSIPTGAAPKFGLTIDNFIGDINSNNKLKAPPNFSDITFTGVVDFNSSALRGKFCGAQFNNNTTVSFPNLTTASGSSALEMAFMYSTIKAVSFPNLTTVSGWSVFKEAFKGCSSLTSVSFPALETVSGYWGCSDMYNGCTNISSIDLSALKTLSNIGCLRYMFQNCGTSSSVSELTVDIRKLETVSGGDGLSNTFNGCSKLKTLNFNALSTLTGSYACNGMLNGCSGLTSVSFPALTTTSFGSNTNQFSNMFNYLSASTSGACTVHFPSNLSSVISGFSGYPTFGGNSSYITLAFDLTATS